MLLTTRERILILIFLVTLSTVCYYFFAYTPINKQISDLEDSIAQKEMEVDVAAVLMMRWGVMMGMRDPLIAESEAYTAYLPDTFDEADILKRIERIFAPFACDTRVVFSDTVTALSTVSVHYADIAFALPYNDLQSVLSHFANDDIHNRIVHFSVSRLTDADGSNILHCDMTVEYLAAR